MAISREKYELEERKQELEWVRTRKLWLPLMSTAFKKEGGGEWKETDLIEFAFDKEQRESEKLSYKEVKGLLGSKIKKGNAGE